MQHSFLPRVFACAVAGVLAFATTLAGAAGPRRDDAPLQAQPQSIVDFTKVINKKLISTSVQGDSARFSLNAGFSDIGVPITFNCAKACLIVVQAMVQVEELNSYWAICPTMDSIDAVDGCNWQGSTSTASSVYVTGNGTYFWSLAAGKHTFQPQIYLSVAGALDNWAMTIQEYQ